MLGLNDRKELRNPCKDFHAFELQLAVQQHRLHPALEHRTSSCSFDVALTVPDQQEHALDQVCRHPRPQSILGGRQSMLASHFGH